MNGLNNRECPKPINYWDRPFVSVIIPVFNDAKRLKICLKALENQTYPQSLYEVIVIDNDSDKIEDVQDIVCQFGQAIATYEKLPGSYAARNKGIALAKGEIIAFTDADCIPSVNWIEEGVKNLLQVPNCGLVAGKIEIFFQNLSCITPVELYESITAFPQKKLVEQHKYGATANLFTFQKVIERVGLFDATLKSNGDVEWGRRVNSFGYKLVYTDDACVLHPARYSWKQLYIRTIRLAGGAYNLQTRQDNSFIRSNFIFLKNLIFDLTPPLMFVFHTFLDSRLQGLEQKIKVSLVMFFVRYVGAWEKLKLKTGATASRE
ncbi:glycosyl transferase family 2 [Chroococcidiopsis cubana CCALA 043]|nr:glycosyl transferase family 2 [Chroococcidiopsis cubana CCALA 043]